MHSCLACVASQKNSGNRWGIGGATLLKLQPCQVPVDLEVGMNPGAWDIAEVGSISHAI